MMRLIDADELKKHIRRCDDSATRATFDYVYEDDIDDMPTVCDIEQIRDAIEREADYQDANVNADIAKGMYLSLEIIDKYKAESEDLGDYPDTIHNQFDNMTGSMNL